jgi:Protein of unknown function (DUF2793)
MPDPIIFDTASPRFGLPLLFAGQAQKELYVNEAHALTDALLHCAIEAEANAPPAVPADGSNWLVGTAPTGDWAGKAGKLACRQAGNWIFVPPRDGMRVLNKAIGQEIRFATVWKAAQRPAAAVGGTVVDIEARAVIVNLINALAVAGIVSVA